MMEYLQMIILGIVQGLTEFLPVSSDGHLVVAGAALGAIAPQQQSPQNFVVTIALHLGTLVAIFIVYRERIGRLVGADRRVLGLLAVATLPAAIAGLVFEGYFSHLLEDPLVAGFMLPLNGGMLLWSRRRDTGNTAYQHLSYGGAFAIGLCQAFALLPGISRSGTTIVAGLALGLRRDAAATFSFLLAIPAIAGAGVLALGKVAAGGSGAAPWGALAIGACVSFVIGLAALRLLLQWLERGRLYLFAYWCIALGVAVVVWQLAG